MKNSTNTPLYMLGKCLGQPLAWVLRKQKPLANWLVSKGIPAKLAQWLLTIANLFILVLLLLAILPTWAIVISIVIMAIMVAASYGVNIDIAPTESRHEYRGGTDGFGVYDKQFGYRVDGGSIEDEEA